MKCTVPIVAILFTAAFAASPPSAHAQRLRFALSDEELPRAASDDQVVAGSYTETASASLEDTLVSSHLSDEGGPSVPINAAFGVDFPAEYQLATYSKGGCKGCDDPGCDCGWRRGAFRSRIFGSFEYTHWYSKGRWFPALVTTSDPPVTPVLGQGQVLFGNERLGGSLQAGGRLNVGFWLDDRQRRALGVRFYTNEGADASFSAASTGDPVLGVPYFDTNQLVGAESALLVAFPGVSTGRLDVVASNDLVGGDIYGRTLFDYGSNYRLDLLAGYQYNRIDDDLVMTTVATTNQPIMTTLRDVFDVRNEYHAGELGLMGEIYSGCWTVTLLGKIAVGNMRQRAAIDGDFMIEGGGAGPGGLFAQPTNSGVFERDLVVWSPEASVRAAYAVTERFSVSAGYTFLYWTRVALAGNLIDRNINSAQITNGNNPVPPPQDPVFTWDDTDYWIQTVDIGFSFNY